VTEFPLGARPGTKIEFIAERQPGVLPSFAEIVAVPFEHDWGPIDTPILCGSFPEFVQNFGDGATPGRDAVAMAFNGQQFLGAAGAGAVLAYRMAVTSGGTQAVAATVALQNTTPATALTLTAEHKGAYGNRLSVVVRDNPANVAQDIFEIRVDGLVRERYIYANTDINGLRDQINAVSRYVTAVANVNGVALAVTAGTALANGVNGVPLTATEWNRMLGNIENQRFAILAPYDVTDAGIQASILATVRVMADAGNPIMALLGGGVGDTVTAAIARAATMNDPHVIMLGHGVYRDTVLAKDLTTSQLVPKVAGVLAARGEQRALTFAKLGSLVVAAGSAAPEHDEIIAAIEGGVTVLSRATSADAELKIERGMTTFTTKNDPARAFKVFSDPRLVRIMDNFQRGMQEWGDDLVVGETAVNDNSRAAVRGEATRRMTDLEDRGLIVPGTGFVSVQEDPLIPDAIPFEFGWVFAHTTNYIRGRGRVR
jgi:hypothetical protein